MRCVADDAIIEQLFVARGGRNVSKLGIVKVERYGPRANGWSWHLGTHLQGDSLIRLDVHDEQVSAKRGTFCAAKKTRFSALQLSFNFHAHEFDGI